MRTQAATVTNVSKSWRPSSAHNPICGSLGKQTLAGPVGAVELFITLTGAVFGVAGALNTRHHHLCDSG